MRLILGYRCFHRSLKLSYTDFGADALIEREGVKEESGSLSSLFLFFSTLSISEINKRLALYNTILGHTGEKH